MPSDESLFESVVGRDDSGEANIEFTKPDGSTLDFNFEEVGTEEAPHDFPDEGTPEVSLSLLPNRGYIEYTEPA